MKFHQRLPAPDLRPFVKFYWVVEAADPATLAPETVVPDGCMEMIFHFGSPFEAVHGNGPAERQPGGFVGGQITRSIVIRPTGAIGMLGVRFRPAGARPLLGMPMDELAGQTVDVADLFGTTGGRVVEKLADARSADARIDIVETFLRRRAAQARAVRPLAQAATDALESSHGRVSVQQLAAEFGVSTRHLNRTLCRDVGLGAKACARIMRLQFALARLKHRGGATLTEIGADAGYFDQAHFIRDFRDFCGVSPGRFAGERRELLDGGD